jgi:hypothetical protein
MAKEQMLTQILYKYPNDDMITENFDIEQDVCDFLGCESITSIGIQAPPGTKFYVNNNTAIVGPTGVFELNNLLKITSFKIHNAAYTRRVILDILYVKGE